MAMSDELQRLGELHQQGVLSDREFASAKARVIDGGSAGHARPDPTLVAINGFKRSRNDRWLGGVCGGLGQITGLAAWIWRLAFALLMLCAGTGALVYLLMWIFVPLEPALGERPALGANG